VAITDTTAAAIGLPKRTSELRQRAKAHARERESSPT